MVTVVLSQTLAVSMDIATNSSSSTADQSLCAPLLAELQLDTFPFDNNGNATCVANPNPSPSPSPNPDPNPNPNPNPKQVRGEQGRGRRVHF